MTVFQARLEECIEAYTTILRAKKRLADLNLRMKETEHQLAQLSDVLEDEYADVLRLQKTSLHKLFSHYLSSNEEQYEIEKQEYLKAVLEYKECKKTLEIMSFEKNILEKKILKEKEVFEQLNDVLKSIPDVSVFENHDDHKKLIEVTKNIDFTAGFKKEVEEGLALSVEIKKLTKEMIDLLNLEKQTDRWGNAYYVSKSVLQHKSHIDAAQEISYYLKLKLQRLKSELADIYNYKSINRVSSYDEFEYFTQIYNDRLISDWIVQKEIMASQNNMVATADSITQIIYTLKTMLSETKTHLQVLYERQDKLLNQSI